MEDSLLHEDVADSGPVASRVSLSVVNVTGPNFEGDLREQEGRTLWAQEVQELDPECRYALERRMVQRYPDLAKVSMTGPSTGSWRPGWRTWSGQYEGWRRNGGAHQHGAGLQELVPAYEWLGTGNTRHTRSERIKRIKRTKRAGWGPTMVKRAAPTSMVGMKAHEELTN